MTSSQTNPGQLLPNDDDGPIIAVDEARRLEAVQRLMAGAGRSVGALASSRTRGAASRGVARAQAEQFIAFAEANAIRIDAMWARLGAAGEVVATVLAVPNPGRTSILFASPPHGRKQIAPLAGLIDHACGQLVDHDLHLAQVLLEPQDAGLREAFLGGGFEDLAHLAYMECPLPRRFRRPRGSLPDNVTIETWNERLEPEVLAVLDESYEDTLDCPGLRGLRETEDILAGHRGTGEFEAELWTLMRVDGAASGVLLLNRSPASNTLELVYMGLAKRVQGSGLGRRLLRHGLHRVADRPERAVTLAVDERNAPAIALYRGEGFRSVLRRVALIRSLRRTERSDA
ncbi:MAG: GNAT family N-acetyltransferase [Planctomycetes bacterium]|nr:GNAT family N-acetyltransferase [Planctomycetota bacterium]